MPNVGLLATPLRSSIAASVVGKSVEMVTLLLLATVVPRALGPSDYGEFALALTVVTLGSLALTLGGPTLMARYVPAAPVGDRVGLAQALGLRLARGRAVQLAVVASGGGVLSVVDSQRFPATDVVIVVGALAVSVATTLLLQTGLGLGKTGAWSARYPLQNSAQVVLAVALHGAYGSRGALASILVSSTVALVVALVSMAPVLAARPARVDVPEGAVRFGSLQAAGAAFTQVTHRGGVVAVALLGGSTVEVGHAALAIGIALGATYAILQIFTVSLPHLAPEHAHAGTEAAEAVFRRLAGRLLVPLVPCAAIAALALEKLVPVAFGDDYRSAADVFGPALALVVLAPVAAVVVQASALRLRADVSLVSGLCSMVVFVGVSILAVPAWEAPGATAAALAGVTVGVLASIRLMPGAVGTRLALSSFGASLMVLGAAIAAGA